VPLLKKKSFSFPPEFTYHSMQAKYRSPYLLTSQKQNLFLCHEDIIQPPLKLPPFQ